MNHDVDGDGAAETYQTWTWTAGDDGLPASVEVDERDGDGVTDLTIAYTWKDGNLARAVTTTSEAGDGYERTWTWTEDGRIASTTSSGRCGDNVGDDTQTYTYGFSGTTYATAPVGPDPYDGMDLAADQIAQIASAAE